MEGGNFSLFTILLVFIVAFSFDNLTFNATPHSRKFMQLFNSSIFCIFKVSVTSNSKVSPSSALIAPAFNTFKDVFHFGY